tara:strand:+ start:70 stop:624 length:555 start_codon:yes stop_codon:yes gene_type:complete
MPKVEIGTLKAHLTKWKNCDLCSLCSTRSKISLYRGSIPCEALFISDAPGMAEDALGEPFSGSEGYLLNSLLKTAKETTGVDAIIGFTYLISCKPEEKPLKTSLKACIPRLKEIVELAQPQTIVMVGKLASKQIPELFNSDDAKQFVSIPHPRELIKTPVHIQGLEIKKCQLSINDIFENLIPF